MTRMRLILCIVVVGAVGLTASGIAGLARTMPGADGIKSRNFPNVVFILVDALRADRVEAERNHVPVMPHLAQWAQGAIRFPHAVTPCTWTRPSMASLFSSLYVDTHQVYTSNDALSDRIESMASFLKKAGFATLGVQTNGNLIRELGFAQGFDTYDYLPSAVATEVTGRALALIQSLPQPFFLYTHYIDPHPMYTPPESYKTMMGYPDPQLSPAEKAVVENFTEYFWDQIDFRLGVKATRSLTPLSPVGEEAVRTLYDGESRFADDQIDILIKDIEAKYPNTIIVLMADHGEHLLDHGFVGHGTSCYEEVLRVPFFIKGPGLDPFTIDDNVCTVDLLPTIAALLGLPARAAWQGHNVLEHHDPHAAMYSCVRPTGPPRDVDIDMVQVGPVKLILDRKSNATELYNLADDPHETANLAAQQPEQVGHFKALIETHRQQNIRARGQIRPQRVELNAAQTEELKNLGYIHEKDGPDPKAKAATPGEGEGEGER